MAVVELEKEPLEAGWAALPRRVLALSLVLLSGWLLMYNIFPLYDPIFPITRDYSTAAQGLLFGLIAVVAMRRPSLLNVESLTVVALGFGVGGVALAYLGVEQVSPPLMVLSSTLLRISMSWIQIVVGVSLANLATRWLSGCIVIAFLLSYLWQYLVFLLPSWMGVATFVAIPFACYFLAVPLVRPAFDLLRTVEPPFEVSVTRPTSFLPFSSQLFVCLLVFNVVKGFLISFGEVEGTPLRTLLSPLAFSVLAVIIIVLKWKVCANRLFDIASLLIIGGLLLVPLITVISAYTPVNLLLSSGIDCFNFLFWYLLASLAARNLHGAVPAFAWGSALSCFGIIVGAFIGRMTDYYTLAAPITAIIIVTVFSWLFIAYDRLLLKRYSFDAAILMIEPESGPLQSQAMKCNI